MDPYSEIENVNDELDVPVIALEENNTVDSTMHEKSQVRITDLVVSNPQVQ